MASVLSVFVFKALCDNQGCLDGRRLNELIARRFTVDKSVLLKVLSDGGKFAVSPGDSGAPAPSDSLFVAKTSLRLCAAPSGVCQGCSHLHLCKYLVLGHCRFGDKCKNPHNLASQYNTALLIGDGLQDLPEKQLFQLLMQNDPKLLPEICPHYNKGNGEHGSCSFKTSCTNLHICKHFLEDYCKFGVACKRAHTFDAHITALTGRGLSRDNIENLGKIYRSKFIISNQRLPALPVPREVTECTGTPAPLKNLTKPATTPTWETEVNEICLYFIRKHCSFQGKCARVHYHLPYKWQVRDAVAWKDLPDNEVIEKAYCDPGKDNSRGLSRETVDFLTMTCGKSPVRRLSTASSVTKPHYYILTTEWLWYWKDDHRKWIEYGQENDHDQLLASLTSQTVESTYQSGGEEEIPFSVGKLQYILYLNEMYQTSLRFKTRRDVRRRPRFVSAQQVEDKLKSTSPGGSTASFSTKAEVFPSHWDQSALPSFGFKRIPLSSSSNDYKTVAALFKLTMPQSAINSIHRIQNPSLWRLFQWQKTQMKQRNGGRPPYERILFHGTHESLVDAICEQNFDWRVCGAHGTLYGKGSYFASDASYSHRYARVTDSPRAIMFMARVLVGEFTKGRGSYVRPPLKGKDQGFYDSCVDTTTDPGIFVVFDKLQIYPEYVINYS